MVTKGLDAKERPHDKSALLKKLKRYADPLEGATTPILVEDEIAYRFTAQSLLPGRDRWLYCARRMQWYRWEPPVWREDGTLGLFDQVRTFIREHARDVVSAMDEAAQKAAHKEAKAVRTARVVSGVERFLRADREHAIELAQLDADPMLMATPGGVVDLTSGDLRPGDPEDYLTKCTRVTPGGACPTWLRFIDEVTDGDEDLTAFLQRAAGYCLTGHTQEHALIFLWGTGANGKSTFLRVLLHLLGDYAVTAPAETFLESHGERHPTELAMLCGPRLVVAQEIDDGRQWALSRIKTLTGGDPIRARYMRGDFFEFQPAFKLILAANHRPGLRNVDEAMRRRLRMVPFTVTIPTEKRDPHLMEKLLEEGGGILAWAIEGCLAWQREGLNAPSGVMAATDDYLGDEDTLSLWMAQRTVRGKGDAGSAQLYADYAKWIDAHGERPTSHKRFSRALEDHGFGKSRDERGARFRGIQLVTIFDLAASPADGS